MQSGGLARFARDVLTKPCCCRGPIPPIVEGLQYISAQRCFTTSDLTSTSSASTASADPADAAAVSAAAQHPETVARDTAKMAYEADMRKLRRKWQVQHAEKLAIKAKAEAVKNANKAVTIEAHRRKVAQMKELRMQIHEEKRRLQIAELAQRQALAAQFRAATEEVYAEVQAQRRNELLEDSKDWITPETLDARIQHAIENPVELYEQVAQQDWSYKSS